MTLKLILILVALAAGGIVYAVVIYNYMAIHNAAVAKADQVATSTGLTKVWTMLLGWKAIICTWIASIAGVVMAIPADTVQAWSALPWSGVVDQKIAAGITIVFGLLGGLFHAQGIATAAKTPPQD